MKVYFDCRMSSTEMGVNFAEVEDIEGNPEITLNGGREGYALKESQSVDSMSKFAEANGNALPLKGHTPPSGRRAKLIRRMTKASKGLKVDSKEWIDRHIRRKGSQEESSSESDADEKAKEKPKSGRKKRYIKKKDSEESAAGESSAPNSPNAENIEMEPK
jgi:hypothetical protein